MKSMIPEKTSIATNEYDHPLLLTPAFGFHTSFLLAFTMYPLSATNALSLIRTVYFNTHLAESDFNASLASSSSLFVSSVL